MSSSLVNPIQTNDIQGDILAGFNKPHVCFLFVNFQTPDAGRKWVAALRARELPAHTTIVADSKKARDKVWVNLSFTAAGLKTLLPAFAGDIDKFEAFRDGQVRRADRLDDPPGDFDAEIPIGRNPQPIAAMLKIAADRQNDLTDAVRLMRQLAEEYGLSFPAVQGAAYEELGQAISDGKHHVDQFGFRDGVSQPSVEGFDKNRGEGQVKPGEFILGCERELRSDGANLPPIPAWMRNGSFSVLRKIAVDSEAWNNQLERIESQLSRVMRPALQKHEIAELLVGRGKDGRPPEIPKYENDRESVAGMRCPMFSHVRKMNPRDEASRLRRIIRRGITYASNGETGLLFHAYMSSIELQFETLQQVWANNPNQPIHRGPDPIIGVSRDGSQEVRFMARPGGPEIVRVERIVKVRGGLYTFVPSISMLNAIGKSWQSTSI